MSKEQIMTIRCRAFQIVALAAIILTAFPAKAQYYTLGTDPASARWKQLATKNYQFIYPEETDSLARVYAYLFELNRANTMRGLKIDPQRIPIILHPYLSRTNGEVVWAPKRVELMTMPPYDDSYPQPWNEQLALHEGRHIGQMTHYTTGVYGVLFYFLGESSAGLGVGFNPSTWIFESDAVVNETVLSNTGRGRGSALLQYYRAASLEGETRLFDHWRYGSFERFTPNQYSFGYLINSYMYSNSDNYYVTGDLLKLLIDNTFKFFTYWKISFEEASGLTDRQNFNKSMLSLSYEWREDDARRYPFTPYKSISNKKENNYTVYSQVIPTVDGVYAVKSGYEHPTHLVKIGFDGNETVIRPFPAYSSKISPSGKGMYWSESIMSHRWSLKDKSIIRYYDFSTKRTESITTKGYLFNPSISPDGNFLSATEYPVTGGSNLILMTSKGTITDTVPAPDHGQITETAWIGDETVYAMIIKEDGEAIWSISQKGGHSASEWKQESVSQYQSMKNMSSDGDALIFESDLDGVSNIFHYEPVSKLLERMTNSRLGAFSPCFDTIGQVLYYTQFDTKGYHPAATPSSELDWKEADFTKPFKHVVAEQIAQQASKYTVHPTEEQKTMLRDSIESLPSKRYNKLVHMFHIHSWAPFYYNIDRLQEFSFPQWYRSVSPGATIFSQNSLGTATSMLGYSYHDGFHSGHFNFNYTGLYPAIDISMDVNDRDRTVSRYNKGFDPSKSISSSNKPFIIDSLKGVPCIEGEATLYVPLDISSSGISRTFSPYVKYYINNDTYFYHPDDPLEKGHIRKSLEYGIQYSIILPKPKSLLYPKWGFGARIAGISSIGNQSTNGTIGYGSFYCYLPGAFAGNHGFKMTFTGQYQNNKLGYGYISNLAKMPRGYSKSLPSTKFAIITGDYAMPIGLHDTYIASQYLMRLQVIPFADVAFNATRDVDRDILYSFGTDILLDAHLFHIGWQFGFGVRCGVTKEFVEGKTNKPFFQFLYSTPMY